MDAERPAGAPAGTTWLDVEGQLVLATPRVSRPVVLDPVSSSLWPLLLDGAPPDELAAALQERHGADPIGASQFADALVDQLRRGGLLLDDGDEGPARRYHSTCSPCDTAPLLKGPTTTVELDVGGIGATVLVLDRTDLASSLEPWRDGPAAADPWDLFVLGRVPREGSPALFDHYGELLVRSTWDRTAELVEILVDDLRRAAGAEVCLRGVAVRVAGGVVVVHERWRAAAAAATTDDPDLAPSPSSLLALRWTPNGPVVTFRAAAAPDGIVEAPLVALGIPEASTGSASATALAATLLRDPCALEVAADLRRRVELVDLPQTGDATTFARWLASTAGGTGSHP